MQDKISAIKITKTRKRELQTHFILIRPLPVPTSSPQATHLIFSTIFVNSLQLLNTPWNPSPLCSRFSLVKRQTIS